MQRWRSRSTTLRGEHDKRRTSEKIADDQLFASAPFDRAKQWASEYGTTKKIPKYVNTRVTEVFPVKKSRNIGEENYKLA
uniref:Uncharacterized protein n=1 Tax=Aegilops tauschii subsp. strangulata TaxID=200361 RepID=A0A453GEZ8_AEGTS